MHKLTKLFSVVLIAALALGMLSAMQPARASAALPVKVLLDNQRTSLALRLDSLGGRLLVDYGSFSLWSLPADQVAVLAGQEGVSVPVDIDRIWLRGDLSFDTPAGEPAIPANLRQERRAGLQLWMVQFIGPIKDEWLQALTQAGLEIVYYLPNNAYVVWGDGAALSRLDGLAKRIPELQWSGAYHAAYRLSPALRDVAASGGGQMVDVTVQFYRSAAVEGSLASLRSLGGKVYKQPDNILVFTNISLQVPAGALAALAGWPDVFNVEPWAAPQMHDEVQNQIVAGNITTSGGNIIPSAPGYLTWLATKSFPTTQSSYPIVDVVDDGLDQGNASNVLHPDFHELGVLANPDRIPYIGNCTNDPTGNAVGGHGNLNAGIVAAYNNLSGSPHVDANGYRIGLGVSPYGRVAGTKIFNNAGSWNISNCGGTDSGVVAASYLAGATFTTNSWGAPVGGAYDSSSQAYDSLTRDAYGSTAGNQQMLHIFSAGNDGSGTNTIGSPGTAKNVMTVGATENVREQGTLDGCNVSYANNADDIAVFSSRGPTDDGRVKPDISAPGTHVQGPASQDPGYNGTGVCDQYHPAAQTLYAWSSGTSHSTPGVAGAASLAYEYYGRVLNPGQTPSPAMLKGLVLNTPRYLNGVGAGGNLPGNGQGWGDPNLGMLFDSSARMFYDQRPADIFGATGEERTFNGVVSNTALPFRVTVVWTDAPGPTSGNAYINNLNLEVTAGGNTYLGNVFSGANSTTGGTADVRNNVESVFIPAGVSGAFTVRVIAGNIAGDGVPGNADTTDQDFALVIYNAALPTGPVLTATGNTLTQVSGNGNAYVDPGETFSVIIPLRNDGTLTATGVSGTLSLTGGSATIPTPTSAYPNIAVGATQNNTTPYVFTVSASQTCGQPLGFRLTVTYGPGGLTLIYDFTVAVGQQSIGAPVTYTSTDVPKAISDYAWTYSTVSVASTNAINDVNITLTSLVHTYDSDLSIYLRSPATTQVELSTNNGGSGNNFINTVFDDEAAIAITAGTAPFTGSYRPEGFLSSFDGQAGNGTWQLEVYDAYGGDSGTLNGWSLTITPFVYICDPYTPGNNPPVLDPIGNRSGNELTQISFTATATDPDPSDTLTFSLDAGAPAGAAITTGGAFTWTPTEAQGPGVYPVTVRVTDNGTPAMNDFETIQITVGEVNLAPVLGVIGNRSGNEQTLISFTATATDADLPANTLAFSLDAGAPAGAAITTGGAFTWTPTEAQGPGVYPVTVRVTDNGTPAMNDFETIQITVGEVNTAPALGAIGNQSVAEGTPLAFTATATDADLPANTLAFSLDAGAPAGAAITTGGSFTWTPTEAQGPGVYPVTVRVTDNGTPALDDFETIQITVSEVNVAPVADAGEDQIALAGATIQLDGSASSDPDGQPLSYGWLQTGGSPEMALSDPHAISPIFTASSVGVFTFTLTVTDTYGLAVSDEVGIRVDTVTAEADLAVTLERGGSTAITITIGVVNLGANPADGALLHDEFSPAFYDITWSCAAANGAACANPSGSGNLLDETIPVLPGGGAVTFTVVGKIRLFVDNSNQVSVSAPAGVFDGDLSNNTAWVARSSWLMLPIIVNQ